MTAQHLIAECGFHALDAQRRPLRIERDGVDVTIDCQAEGPRRWRAAVVAWSTSGRACRETGMADAYEQEYNYSAGSLRLLAQQLIDDNWL